MILTGYFNGDLKHRCTPDTASTWGCTRPVSRPRWNLPCYLCNGERGVDPECVICHGQGETPQTECPTKANTGTMDSAFKHYANLVNYGVLPMEGGTLEQSASFMYMLDVIPTMSSTWQVQKERKKKLLDDLKRRKNVKR